MSTKILLLLIVALAAVSATDLQFDLYNTKYTKASDYWTVDVPVIGGSGQYLYSCELPEGWKQQGNYFKIPASCSANYNKQYVSRCKCRDTSYGHVLERSLIFTVTTSGYVVSDRDYFFGSTTASAGTKGSITGLDVLKRLSDLTNNKFKNFGSSFESNFGSSVSGGSYSGSSVSGGSYSGSSSTSSQSSSSSGYTVTTSTGGSVTHGFLSWVQVDELIKNGDISEILQLIQKVVSSQVNCDTKTAYLSDLLGRVLSAIEIKTESVNQIKNLISGALVQIEKLTIEIKSFKTQQSSLNIQGLKDNLNALLLKLKAAYAQYNTCSSSTTEYEREIIEIQNELVIIEKKVSEITVDLEYCLRQLSEINSQISQLEKRLQILKQERQVIEEKIANFRAVIQVKNTRIVEIRQRITYLKQKISTVSGNCSKLRGIYEKIQVEVNQLKRRISEAQEKYLFFEQKISSILIEIERFQVQVSEYEIKLKFIKQCIQNLNSAIHEIKQTINFLYYHCYDIPDVIIDDDEDEPCFKFGQNDWFKYLQNSYGASQSKFGSIFSTTTIEIKTINIFSTSFSSAYGSKFRSQIKDKASHFDSQKSYGFDGDFSCSSSYSGLSNNSGKIKNISNQHVDVEGQDGRSYKLKLGSCSRFEGKGKDFVPKSGQKILWKGSSSGSSYNLHSCTCY